MDRITDAFSWPARDPRWVGKVAVMGLILLIPIAGVIIAIGWMLATLDRLRAGDQKLAPAGLHHFGRGVRLFAVDLAYGIGIVIVSAVVYAPGVAVLSQEGRGPVNGGLVALGIGLSLLSFGILTLCSLAFTFATPAIVLATDGRGIRAGLNVAGVLRVARASMTNTLFAGLMLIAASFVGMLGAIACGVGLLFTAAYSLAMQAWIVHCYEMGSARRG